VEDRPVNAILSWVLVGSLALGAVADGLAGDWLWTGFALTIVAVATVPPVVTGDPSVIVSWEALLLTTLPLAAQFVDGFVDPLTYVSVATLALLVAVELVTFSETRMAPWFAVPVVVMTTMTVAGIWGVVQ
jgi:predicted tellurium resistance membrane protein TerC